MTFLGPKILGNFRPQKTPHKTPRVSAAQKRPGMSPDHLAKVRQLSSCISGKRPCDPHHLKKKDERGVGMKATDRWAVPLTRDEHNEIERLGSRREVAWFLKRGIDVYALATALWLNNHSVDAMEKIVETHRTKGTRDDG